MLRRTVVIAASLALLLGCSAQSMCPDAILQYDLGNTYGVTEECPDFKDVKYDGSPHCMVQINDNEKASNTDHPEFARAASCADFCKAADMYVIPPHP